MFHHEATNKQHCVVPEKKPYHGKSLEFPRGRGVLKAKFLEAMWKKHLEFPEGRGV